MQGLVQKQKYRRWLCRCSVGKHVTSVGVSVPNHPVDASAVVIERFNTTAERSQDPQCVAIAIAQGLAVKVILVNGRQFQNSTLDI